MRHSVLASILLLGVAAGASAQAVRVEITDGNFRAGMHAVDEPYASGAPWAGIPAVPLKAGSDPTVTEFRIRSWSEPDGVRVLVFAATVREVWREASEQQIASLLVPIGRSVEVTATEKYGARRITLLAERRAALPYRLERRGIDVPLPIFAPRRR